MKSLTKSWFVMLMFLFAVMLAPIGCASHNDFQKAFDAQSALTHNQCTFTQPADSLFATVKQVFIQQGFTIESADQKSGIIRAVRNMPDKKDKEISYNISASANISEIGDETSVSLAASQQTVLHRATTTWWHLLWIVPIIPTGTEYQTLVINEGNITDPAMYTDFFNSCKVAATKYELAIKAAAAKAAEKAEKDRIAAEKKAEMKRAADAKAALEKEEAIAKDAAEKAAKIKEAEDTKAAAEKAQADSILAAKDSNEKPAADPGPLK